MERVARVIVAERYGTNGDVLNHKEVREKTTELALYKPGFFEELRGYSEIVITGGDPFVVEEKMLRDFVKELKRQNRNRKIGICTTCLRADEHGKTLNFVDSLTVIVRPDATDDDIYDLKCMSENLNGAMLYLRLFIDKSIYKKYDLRNIQFSTWDVVKKIKWEVGYELKSKDDLYNLILD